MSFVHFFQLSQFKVWLTHANRCSIMMLANHRPSPSQPSNWASNRSLPPTSIRVDFADYLPSKKKKFFQESFGSYRHIIIDHFFAIFGFTFFGDTRSARLLSKLSGCFIFFSSILYIAILIFWAIHKQSELSYVVLPLFNFIVRFTLSLSFHQRKNDIMKLNHDMRSFWKSITLDAAQILI